jgi:membrane fusion protein (multidrug efflux system)
MLGVVGCDPRPNPESDNEEAPKEDAMPVEVMAITRGSIEATIQSSTHLEAEADLKVFARTANRVTELLVEEGDLVQKGDVLLRLENDRQKTAYAKALASRDKALEEFEREKVLYERQLVSEQVFNNAEYEMKQLQLAFEDAARELEYTEVRAPITGTISQRMVKYGDLVNLNQHLFDIVDFNSIVARIYVPEKSLPDLRLGQAARVTATPFGETEHEGYVKRIAPVVDARTGTVKVTIGFPDVGDLRPGMYVDVDLITANRSDALLITKRALLYDGELTYVFRLLPERKVERVLVQPRIVDRFNVEPASGFEEGDEIVIVGQSGLKDGATVRLPGDPDPDEEVDNRPETAEQPSDEEKS